MRTPLERADHQDYMQRYNLPRQLEAAKRKVDHLEAKAKRLGMYWLLK